MSDHKHRAFGDDPFGRFAERAARSLGTPYYIVGQTLVVIAWIAMNGLYLAGVHFDPYPFILLNLAFSTQAAYAAPLILLAQTRQADRDKRLSDLAETHREQLAQTHADMLAENTRLTEQNAALTEDVRSLTRTLIERG